VSSSCAQKLFEAAGEPKQVRWFDCSPDGLPGEAWEVMHRFLREALAR